MAAVSVGGQGSALTALTVYDFSDRELLLIVMEICEGNGNGFATSIEIAEQLGIRSKHPQASVGSRMAMLKRIGAVLKNPEVPENKNSEWAVTPLGASLATGRLKASTERAIDNMDEGQLLLLTRKVGQSYSSVNTTAGQLLRREWKTQTGLRG